jgi:hypothetical protein
MVCEYGTILASSVPYESVFSTASLHTTKRRNRLAPKTIGVIMYLRSWDLIRDGKDDDTDEDTDDNDGPKDRGFGRTEINDVQVDSQLLSLYKAQSNVISVNNFNTRDQTRRTDLST